MTRPKARRRTATRAERQVASDLGGRRTFLSGAGDEKADVSVPREFVMVDGVLQETAKFSFRAEVKTTESDSYTLRNTDWLKVVQAADRSGQIPIFVMKISLKNFPFVYVAIPYSFFQELYGVTGVATRHDINKRSLRITRKTLPPGHIPHRRVGLVGTRGDVVILEYNDFLQLVKIAEEEM